MQSLQKLVKGYKSFLQTDAQTRYRTLAESGQSPKIMMIGCCDSRVSPDLIFNTRPGDLFVVRNVANLVPPFEPDGGYHGTSAALEFAVTGLGIQHIVVMGHSQCGGVRACCEYIQGKQSNGLFIPQWTSMLNACAEKVRKSQPDISTDDLSRAVEFEGIRYSLGNLSHFPFVQERVASGALHIHGAYFELKNVQLYALNQDIDEFVAVE